jgi:hypothetical protein
MEEYWLGTAPARGKILLGKLHVSQGGMNHAYRVAMFLPSRSKMVMTDERDHPRSLWCRAEQIVYHHLAIACPFGGNECRARTIWGTRCLLIITYAAFRRVNVERGHACISKHHPITTRKRVISLVLHTISTHCRPCKWSCPIPPAVFLCSILIPTVGMKSIVKELSI